MKKVFAIILSAMIVMSFAACGNSNSGTDSKTEGTSSVASTESSKVESSQSESKNESSNTSNTESSVLSTALEKVKAEVELPSDMADFDERRLKRVFGITDEQAEDFPVQYALMVLDKMNLYMLRPKMRLLQRRLLISFKMIGSQSIML